MKLHRKRKKRM